jgi:hypothetical protein
MTITKANIVTKSDFVVSSTPIANKVTAADLNEIKRASDDTIDALNNAEHGGLYICNGTGTQSIASGAQITINQWTTAQPDNGLGVENGDQTITIPTAGTYMVLIHLSYETTSKDDEIFTFFVYAGANPVAGLCTRQQHHEPDVNIYAADFYRLAAFSAGDVLSVRVDASALDESRTFDIKHGTFTVFRVGV